MMTLYSNFFIGYVSFNLIDYNEKLKKRKWIHADFLYFQKQDRKWGISPTVRKLIVDVLT